MRKLFAAALLLLLSLAPVQAAKLFVVGDSVSTETKINGWSTGQSWGAIVASNAGLTPVFLAVAGYTTAQMQSQINTVIAQYAAGDTISMQPGENDISVTMPAVFKATLDGQIVQMVNAGIPASKITLHTPFIIQATNAQGLAYQGEAPAYLQAIREVAFARGVALIDVYTHFAELTQTIGAITQFYMPNDVQHPGVMGQAEIARLYSLPQNANSAAYHTASAFSPIGKPWIVTAPLHQVSGAGVTLLSAQVAYIDASGASPVTFHVQDYLPPGEEVALILDGLPFPCPDSTTITPAQFSRMMIAPVTHPHDVWVSVNNGYGWSSGIDFSVTPP